MLYDLAKKKLSKCDNKAIISIRINEGGSVDVFHRLGGRWRLFGTFCCGCHELNGDINESIMIVPAPDEGYTAVNKPWIFKAGTKNSSKTFNFK